MIENVLKFRTFLKYIVIFYLNQDSTTAFEISEQHSYPVNFDSFRDLNYGITRTRQTLKREQVRILCKIFFR